jgi:hypothetical protein
MDKGVNFQYTGFDPELLKADIEKFRKENNLGSISKIVYVQITGGYDAAKESLNAGTVTAITFSVNMKKDLPDLFNSADFKIATSADLAPNSVALRIVFA